MVIKKIIKILLIVIMCFIIAYGIKALYGVLIFNSASTEDQLKIVQANYNRCVSEGKDDCEDILMWGMKKTLKTQVQELIPVVLNKTLSEDERWGALQMFYTLSKNEQEFLSKETGKFYFTIANDKENPNDLRELAAKFLLRAKTKDENVKKLQKQVLESPDASSEYKREAIKAIANSGDDDAIDVLLRTLEDTDPSIVLKASGALLGQWPEIKNRIPDLLRFAFNETKPLLARSEIIGLFKSFVIYYDYKDTQAIKQLPALLNHSYYPIRSATVNTLKVLTGKEYEIEPGTEKEKDEFLDTILFGR